VIGRNFIEKNLEKFPEHHAKIPSKNSLPLLRNRKKTVNF